MSAALTSWLLTFLVDSTLLLAAAWLLGATALRRAPRRREFVWRTAIVVSLAAPGPQMATGRSVPIEPILQRAAPIRPLRSPVETAGTGAVRKASGERGSATGASPEARPTERPPSAHPARRLLRGEAVDTPRAGGPGEVGGGGSNSGREAGRSTTVPPGSPAITGVLIPYLLRLWMGIALAGLTLVAWRHFRFLRALGARRPVPPSPTRTAFETLRRGRGTLGGVRLTGSTALPAPATLSGREICVPWPRFATLEPGRQRALLAHELAHVERRDPLWRWAVQLLVTAFFFQPLLRMARRELRAASERLADERAVRQTGAPDVVAAALGEVAEWIASAHVAHSARTVGAVDGESDLVDRVRSILGGAAGIAVTWSRRQRGGMGTVTLAMTVLAVPAIATVGAESDGPPALPQVRTVPDTPRASGAVENAPPHISSGSWTVTDEALSAWPAAGSTGSPRLAVQGDRLYGVTRDSASGPETVDILELSR